MDFENFHNVYENQQKCLIYMFWVELRGSEKFDNIFVSITASSTSQIIFCIELNLCNGMVQEQLDDICASFFASQQKCSPSKIISCI